MHQYSLYYLLAANVVTFILYGMDKYKAKKAKWAHIRNHPPHPGSHRR